MNTITLTESNGAIALTLNGTFTISALSHLVQNASSLMTNGSAPVAKAKPTRATTKVVKRRSKLADHRGKYQRITPKGFKFWSKVPPSAEERERLANSTSKKRGRQTQAPVQTEEEAPVGTTAPIL